VEDRGLVMQAPLKGEVIIITQKMIIDIKQVFYIPEKRSWFDNFKIAYNFLLILNK
jgi:hypothetical protein